MAAARDAIGLLDLGSFDDPGLAKLETILWRGGATRDATAICEMRLRRAWSVDRPLPPSLTTAGRTMFLAQPELFSYLATRSVCVVDGVMRPDGLGAAFDYVVQAGPFPPGTTTDRTDIHVTTCTDPISRRWVRIRLAFAADAASWRAYCSSRLDHAAQELFGDESLGIAQDLPQPAEWNLPGLSPAARCFLHIVLRMGCCAAVGVIAADGSSHTLAP